MLDHAVQAIDYRLSQGEYNVVYKSDSAYNYISTPCANDLDEKVLHLQLCILHYNLPTELQTKE